MANVVREKAFQSCDKHGRIQPAVVNLDHLKTPKATQPAPVKIETEPSGEDADD